MWNVWRIMVLIVKLLLLLVIQQLLFRCGIITNSDYSYTIYSYFGQALDNYYASPSNGNKIQTWTYNVSSAQKWFFIPKDVELYNIVNESAGKCVDDFASATADGSPVLLWVVGL